MTNAKAQERKHRRRMQMRAYAEREAGNIIKKAEREARQSQQDLFEACMLVANLQIEIESLHNIMATPELMKIWLDGKHMKAHTLSVEMMEQMAQATADATAIADATKEEE